MKNELVQIILCKRCNYIQVLLIFIEQRSTNSKELFKKLIFSDHALPFLHLLTRSIFQLAVSLLQAHPHSACYAELLLLEAIFVMQTRSQSYLSCQ